MIFKELLIYKNQINDDIKSSLISCYKKGIVALKSSVYNFHYYIIQNIETSVNTMGH